MSIIKRFNGIIPLLLLLCFAVALPGWASSPTPAMMDGPSLSSGDKPGDKAPVTRENDVEVYAITCSCTPSAGGSAYTPSFAAAGERVYITATPNEGYVITGVYSGQYGYSLVQYDEDREQYYFDMPYNSVDLIVVFQQPYNITTECYPPEGGTIYDYPTSYTRHEYIRYKVATNDGYILNHTGYYSIDGGYYSYANGPYSGVYQTFTDSGDIKLVAYFGTNTAHNITVTGNPGDFGTVNVVPSAMPGEEVTVTVTGTQDYGCSVYYTYDGYNGSNMTLKNLTYDNLNNKITGKFTMPAADVNIIVNYIPLSTFHYECCPENGGTVTATLDGGRPLIYGNKFRTSYGSDVYYADNVRISATPRSGYTRDKFIITYTNEQGETVTEERNMPNYSTTVYSGGDISVIAVFKPYAITTQCVPADGGSITGAPSTASSGAQVNFTVTPNTGYNIMDVTVTTITGEAVTVQSGGQPGQYSFTMPAYPVHIVANFTTPHHINVVCDPADAGEIGLMDMEDEQYGGVVTQFAVMAHDGYILGSVTSTSDDFEYVFVEHQEEEYEGETIAFDIYSFIMPDEDVTLTAHFIPADTRYNITAINETPERGTINVVSTAQVAATVQVTVQGTDNYTGISEGLQVYYYDENNNKKPINVTVNDVDLINNVITVDFTMPAADVFVETVFEPIYSITTVCNPSEGGTLSIESENGLFYGNKALENTPLQLTWTIEDGYSLSSLSMTYQTEEGEEITEELPSYIFAEAIDNGYLDFTMPSSDITLSAVFGRMFTVTTNIISPSGSGTILGGTMIHGETNQCPAGVEYIFFAEPEDGYDLDISDINAYYVNQNNQRVSVPVGFRYDDDFGAAFFYFTMPSADVTLEVEFKPTHLLAIVNDPESDAGELDHIIIGNEFYNPYDLGWPLPLGEGKQVKLNFRVFDGYFIESVIMKNETTEEETTLTAINGYYTLTMPDADVTVTAKYSTGESLYLLGTANGKSTWSTSGVPFEIIDGQYTAMVYFKGYSDDESETDGMGYFVLSTANNENDDWDAIAEYLLTAPSDKFPALQDGETSAVQQLYNESQLKKFMVPAGIYKITVSPDFTTMTINRIMPSITINPEPYYQIIGQPISVSGVDWFINTILQINPDEREYAEHVAVTDQAGNWQSDYFNNTFVLRSSGVTTVTATNSVGYITASATKEYNVFDQQYPPLQFIEGSNVFDNPEFFITTDDEVTVGDELIGVWGAKNILWAKDQGQMSAKYLYIPEGTTDYLRETFKIQKRDWDQSNWVMLDFSALYPDWETNEQTYRAMHEKIATYVDHKIEAKTVKGTYIAPGFYFREHYNPINPTDPMGNRDFEYTKGMHSILLSEFPVAVEQPVSATLGYPGYVEDPTEKAGKFYDDPSQYMYNHYTPVNFMAYDYKPSEFKNVPLDENPFVYSAGPHALSNVAGSNDEFFFMQPKDAEVAHVWAVWKGTMTFLDDYTADWGYNGELVGEKITRDVFETYQPGTDAQGHSYNSYGIEGAFQVYSWQWNRLPATDADQTPRYGKPEEELVPNTPYLFHIAILHAYNTHRSPAPVPVKGATAPIASILEPNSIYRVFPLDMERPSDSTTGVDEAVIDRNDAAYEIVDITYYNVMGMASKRPFGGINIEVTTYSDGHKTSRKILTRN